MADIFVSYTSSDQQWAFWIGQELEKLGHNAHIHEWEISGGGDISAWMEKHHHGANHVLCVISEAYLKAPYSSWERRAAQWVATTHRPNFTLPVFIESCEPPTLLAPLKRCELHGLNEDEARAGLVTFMKPAAKPTEPVPFPGALKRATEFSKAPIAFPGGPRALSNIPISVPRYFLGRDEVLTKIEVALGSDEGRVAITALHGLRGVGKTTLAAAYAEQHRADYRATWWIRAQEPSTMRADLVGLGVRIGWVATDATEESALATVMEQLRKEDKGILLLYDNANNAGELAKYLPRGGETQIIITSTAPDWRRVAAPIEIEVWPKEVGADYLFARTGREGGRDAALALSEALGGLPLAHEQAAAYCERISISFAEYIKRFEAAPVRLLDAEKDAPAEYHDRITVAKTFALAIDEAAKVHPAAEPLIVYAALLAPEPIPLFLFAEALEQFGEPLATALADDGLDELVAALRAFALVDRESIPDERDPSIITDCIRLHRLVRQVAAARCGYEARVDALRALIDALAVVYPSGVYDDPKTWPRARRLDALAVALVGGDADLPEGSDAQAAVLLGGLESYRHGVLYAYAEARRLSERALEIREKVFGPNHRSVAISLNNLARLLHDQGDLMGARAYFERAVAIHEEVLGPDHLDTTASLNNLGGLLLAQGDLMGARSLYERALVIREKALGPDHPGTATSVNNLGYVFRVQGDSAGARSYYERALAIREKTLGPNHPDTATSLNNLGYLLYTLDDLAGARPLYERALVIDEKVLGPEHPNTATDLTNLADLQLAQGDIAGARSHAERALAIFEKILGPTHPSTRKAASLTADLLTTLAHADAAKALRKKFGVTG